ncbi:hypothetical protein LZ30DRAFT_733760 [Colletotrichum cereale]|nr:hypothetical protein LZ30DRAFT_733760 [Colletotrichum cereale]
MSGLRAFVSAEPPIKNDLSILHAAQTAQLELPIDSTFGENDGLMSSWIRLSKSPTSGVGSSMLSPPGIRLRLAQHSRTSRSWAVSGLYQTHHHRSDRVCSGLCYEGKESRTVLADRWA